MLNSDHSSNLVRSFVRHNPKADKVLFYLTSYAFPWWVYALPIARLRRRGYEVVVYDFHDGVLENDDPTVLLTAIQMLVSDMAQRKQAYENKGLRVFHGMGNSLGSFMLYNFCLHHSLDAVVFNGGGSIAEVIFHHESGSWKRIADAYTAKGLDLQALKQIWADVDSPEPGKYIKAKRMMLSYSLKDGTIPLHATEPLVHALHESGKLERVQTDNKPHIWSVIWQAYKVHEVYDFLNPTRS